MSRVAALADVERLVLEASEALAHDAEAADRVLDEALVRFNAIPVAPWDDGPSLEAAQQLASAVEALTDRLEREKARVAAEIGMVQSGRVAANGYAAQGGLSKFARLG